MSEEERRDIRNKINGMLDETGDSELMEVYWYLKVYIN